MLTPKVVHLSPGRILFLSFLCVIGMGVLFLSLDSARLIEIRFIDLLFTATSSTCVTGLYTVPISSFSSFGKCVILCLIQIGGLGLMTLSFFLVSLFLNLGMATKFIASKILDFEAFHKMSNFLGLMIGLTVCIETIGALLLFPVFAAELPLHQAIFYAVFHAVSAFCNAGISLYDNNIVTLQQNPYALTVLALLTISGGIGFIVWYELVSYLREWWHHKKYRITQASISLHSKIVLTTSAALIVFGAIMITALEWHHAFAHLSPLYRMLNGLFLSITSRSTGFATFFMTDATMPTMLVLIILMFIGASPSSTGSGVKTTTFALFLATVLTIIRNRSVVEIYGRTIPTDQIYKAMTIIALGVAWLVFITFALLIIEPGNDFLSIFFEAASACSTGGLTTGISTSFSTLGKICLMVSMLVGRVGTLTLVLALRKSREKQTFSYPEERIIIG